MAGDNENVRPNTDRIQMALHRPRTATAAMHAAWKTGIADVMRRSQIPGYLLEGPPTRVQLRKANPDINSDQLEDLLDSTMAEYQARNTSFWDVIRPTVCLDGDWADIDESNVQQHFVIGDLRDGVGFYWFTLSFGDKTAISEQLKIVKEFSNFPHLDVSNTCSIQRIQLHLTRLLRIWLQINGNTVNHPHSWIIKVLETWPTSPNTVAVSLRSWLAEKITDDNEHVVSTPHKLIAAVGKHAITLGLPQQNDGINREPGALLPFDKIGQHSNSNANGKKGRPREGKNNCTLCNSDLCQDPAKGCIVVRCAKGELDADHVPGFPADGPHAITASERFHLKQSAKLVQGLGIGRSIKELRLNDELAKLKKKEGPNGTDGKQITALIDTFSASELRAEISDGTEFGEWASTIGFDVMCPILESVPDHGMTTIPEDGGSGVFPQPTPTVSNATAPSPGFTRLTQYDTNSEAVAAAIQEALNRAQKQSDQRMALLEAQLAEQREIIQAQQQMVPDQIAPAPPAAPSTIAPPHMQQRRPTPVPNSALANLRGAPSRVPKQSPTEQVANAQAHIHAGLMTYNMALASYERALAKKGYSFSASLVNHIQNLSNWIGGMIKNMPKREILAYAIVAYFLTPKALRLTKNGIKLALVKCLTLVLQAAGRGFTQLNVAMYAIATLLGNKLRAHGASSITQIIAGEFTGQPVNASQLAVDSVLAPLAHAAPSVTHAEILNVQRGIAAPRLGMAGTDAVLHGAQIPLNAELSDNGATGYVMTTMLGVIPGTHQSDASGGFKLGDGNKYLSHDTYLCCYWRTGHDGSRRAKIARRHFMPHALCTIGAEPVDVYTQNEKYMFDSDGRVNQGSGITVNLFMSSNGLGWYQNSPITEPDIIRALLETLPANEQPVVAIAKSMLTTATTRKRPDRELTKKPKLVAQREPPKRLFRCDECGVGALGSQCVNLHHGGATCHAWYCANRDKTGCEGEGEMCECPIKAECELDLDGPRHMLCPLIEISGSIGNQPWRTENNDERLGGLRCACPTGDCANYIAHNSDNDVCDSCTFIDADGHCNCNCLACDDDDAVHAYLRNRDVSDDHDSEVLDATWRRLISQIDRPHWYTGQGSEDQLLTFLQHVIEDPEVYTTRRNRATYLSHQEPPRTEQGAPRRRDARAAHNTVYDSDTGDLHMRCVCYHGNNRRCVRPATMYTADEGDKCVDCFNIGTPDCVCICESCYPLAD